MAEGEFGHIVGSTGGSPRLPGGSVVGGQRVYDLHYFNNPRKRDAAEFGIFADGVLTIGEIDAEDLVAGDIAVLPLDRGHDGAERC